MGVASKLALPVTALLISLAPLLTPHNQLLAAPAQAEKKYQKEQRHSNTAAAPGTAHSGTRKPAASALPETSRKSLKAHPARVVAGIQKPGPLALKVPAEVQDRNQKSAQLFPGKPGHKTALLIALGAAALACAVYLFRLYQIRLIQQLRSRIAADLHDEVGGWLTRISVYTELFQAGLYNEEEQQQAIRNIATSTRMAVTKMGEVVWAAEEEGHELSKLLSEMHLHAENMLHPLQRHYSIRTEELPAEANMAPELYHHLLLIFKETVNNSCKYAKATHFEAILRRMGGEFELDMRDNGISQMHRLVGSGFGLRSMQKRAAHIGGTLTIKQQNGFRVRLRLPAFC